MRHAAYTLVCLLLGVTAWVPMCAGQVADGDSLRFSYCFPDSYGVVIQPDSARAYVYYESTLLDSTKTFGAVGPTEMTVVGGGNNCLQWTWVLPDTVADLGYNVQLHAYVRATGDAFVDDWSTRPKPSVIFVNAAGGNIEAVLGNIDGNVAGSVSDVVNKVSADTVDAVVDLIETITATVSEVDSFTVNAVMDFFTVMADSSVAFVDSSSCTPCGIYNSGGAGVTGATVWITSDSTFTSPMDVVSVALRGSVAGYWSTFVPIQTGAADTVYVWSLFGQNLTRTGTRIVIP